MIEYIPGGPPAGEFDILSLWLRVVIVKPLFNLLNEILAGIVTDIIQMRTYFARLRFIEGC